MYSEVQLRAKLRHNKIERECRILLGVEIAIFEDYIIKVTAKTSKRTVDIFGGLDQLDKKSVSFLLKAIQENNLPGFDYLEFKQALKGLRDMNMDDNTAIKSAFTTGKTVGLSKAKLISSAEHYRQVLIKEKQQFDTALQKQLDQRVHGRKKEKGTLTQKIAGYEKKIKELETEILKIKDRLGRADAEIEDAKSKINGTKDKFETTYQSFIGEIDRDLDLLKSVL